MKNSIVIVILSIVSVSSLVYGYMQKSRVESIVATCVSEKQELEKLARLQQLHASEFEKLAKVAQQEAMIQRTICEEQLKAFKK